MKKMFYLLVVWLISASVCWAQPPALIPTSAKPPAEPVQPLNRIVAVVNDEIITQSELDTAVDQFRQQLLATNTPLPSPTQLREETLDQLINFRLQMQMAGRANIHPTDAEVSQAIELIAQSHHLTVDRLKDQLALQNTPYVEFRKKIAEQLTISKLQQQMVASQLKVTDAEIAAYKTSNKGSLQYKIADFFLPVSEQPSPEELDRALTQAHNIQQQLENGADIDKIVPAYQDLGWRTQEELPQLFVEQIPKLKEQKISLPLRAPNGYHVLKLIDTRYSNQQLTDDEARQAIFRQKYADAVKEAIAKARREAYVRIIPQ